MCVRRAMLLWLAMPAVLTLFIAWVHWTPPGHMFRARALLASTPSWAGDALLTAPGLQVLVQVRWQRPGWWRISGAGGGSAYDGSDLTVRLPDGTSYAAPGTGGAWTDLWPAGALALATRGSLAFGPGGWPVGWSRGDVTVRYRRVTRVPALPRADFRLPVVTGSRASPPVLGPVPGVAAFAPRFVPGLRPEWQIAVQPPGEQSTEVLVYATPAGTITLAENPGDCSGAPLWVQTPDGWIVHWCTGGLAFTARGPDDRAALDRLVQALP